MHDTSDLADQILDKQISFVCNGIWERFGVKPTQEEAEFVIKLVLQALDQSHVTIGTPIHQIRPET